ncbi:MAG: hypothetical protein WCX59_04240, partial [Anaerovoracaceae bacterium]
MFEEKDRVHRIWSRDETLDREQYRQLQLQRLQETVRRVYEKVPFYEKRFREMGLEPGDIKRLEDTENLPFTTKEDFR